ncbi:uncharacterized protein QC761_0029260 [Podospora bellae-mahoneyi]|uniref:Uncharacterized protein n=2 Tax=Podospora TaxID=5144 RepID=A0ABR0FVP9_9PEZI|nr:hypothetical protein QC761_0029260 [Podospora bellae-mahoneyi]KAK4680638.1 hypothetical protein QC764_0000810 [Podospora pseudoanserina]
MNTQLQAMIVDIKNMKRLGTYFLFTINKTPLVYPLTVSFPFSTPASCSSLSISLLHFLNGSLSVPASSG